MTLPQGPPPVREMKNRVKKPVRAAIDRIIAAAFAVIFFGLLRQAIRDGHAAQVAMLGGLLLVFGTLVLWSGIDASGGAGRSRQNCRPRLW